ncbi:MAG: hypothetical protein HYY37_03835 [Candidatus Aenigmarchaeota archaeon]|nr:hypothetical protein [Candidatus Aenigmarchaeota archaeon]
MKSGILLAILFVLLVSGCAERQEAAAAPVSTTVAAAEGRLRIEELPGTWTIVHEKSDSIRSVYLLEKKGENITALIGAVTHASPESAASSFQYLDNLYRGNKSVSRIAQAECFFHENTNASGFTFLLTVACMRQTTVVTVALSSETMPYDALLHQRYAADIAQFMLVAPPG